MTPPCRGSSTPPTSSPTPFGWGCLPTTTTGIETLDENETKRDEVDPLQMKGWKKEGEGQASQMGKMSENIEP